MRSQVGLGRVLGVRIGFNWSLLLIAVILAAGLAHGRLPGDAPGYTMVAYITAGVLTAVLFIITVLVHELSHAVVAHREKMTVEGINLTFLGGMTYIEGDVPSAGAEARIAGVGPLATLAVAGVFALLRLAVDPIGAGSLWLSVLGWLSLINLVLGLFNLFPASPLDGGRLLHAGIWALTHDRRRADRVAVFGGLALGAVVVVFGLFQMWRDGPLAGVWTVAGGIFVAGAARHEAIQARQFLPELVAVGGGAEGGGAEGGGVPAGRPADRAAEP